MDTFNVYLLFDVAKIITVFEAGSSSFLTLEQLDKCIYLADKDGIITGDYISTDVIPVYLSQPSQFTALSMPLEGLRTLNFAVFQPNDYPSGMGYAIQNNGGTTPNVGCTIFSLGSEGESADMNFSLVATISYTGSDDRIRTFMIGIDPVLRANQRPTMKAVPAMAN